MFYEEMKAYEKILMQIKNVYASNPMINAWIEKGAALAPEDSSYREERAQMQKVKELLNMIDAELAQIKKYQDGELSPAEDASGNKDNGYLAEGSKKDEIISFIKGTDAIPSLRDINQKVIYKQYTNGYVKSIHDEQSKLASNLASANDMTLILAEKLDTTPAMLQAKEILDKKVKVHSDSLKKVIENDILNNKDMRDMILDMGQNETIHDYESRKIDERYSAVDDYGLLLDISEEEDKIKRDDSKVAEINKEIEDKKNILKINANAVIGNNEVAILHKNLLKEDNVSFSQLEEYRYKRKEAYEEIAQCKKCLEMIQTLEKNRDRVLNSFNKKPIGTSHTTYIRLLLEKKYYDAVDFIHKMHPESEEVPSFNSLKTALEEELEHQKKIKESDKNSLEADINISECQTYLKILGANNSIKNIIDYGPMEIVIREWPRKVETVYMRGRRAFQNQINRMGLYEAVDLIHKLQPENKNVLDSSELTKALTAEIQKQNKNIADYDEKINQLDKAEVVTSQIQDIQKQIAENGITLARFIELEDQIRLAGDRFHHLEECLKFIDKCETDEGFSWYLKAFNLSNDSQNEVKEWIEGDNSPEEIFAGIDWIHKIEHNSRPITDMTILDEYMHLDKKLHSIIAESRSMKAGSLFDSDSFAANLESKEFRVKTSENINSLKRLFGIANDIHKDQPETKTQFLNTSELKKALTIEMDKQLAITRANAELLKNVYEYGNASPDVQKARIQKFAELENQYRIYQKNEDYMKIIAQNNRIMEILYSSEKQQLEKSKVNFIKDRNEAQERLNKLKTEAKERELEKKYTSSEKLQEAKTKKELAKKKYYFVSSGGNRVFEKVVHEIKKTLELQKQASQELCEAVQTGTNTISAYRKRLSQDSEREENVARHLHEKLFGCTKDSYKGCEDINSKAWKKNSVEFRDMVLSLRKIMSQKQTEISDRQKLMADLAEKASNYLRAKEGQNSMILRASDQRLNRIETAKQIQAFAEQSLEGYKIDLKNTDYLQVKDAYEKGIKFRNAVKDGVTNSMILKSIKKQCQIQEQKEKHVQNQIQPKMQKAVRNQPEKESKQFVLPNSAA